MVLEIVMTMAGTFPLLGYMFCKRRYKMFQKKQKIEEKSKMYLK